MTALLPPPDPALARTGALLAIRGVSHAYGPAPRSVSALAGIDLALRSGEFVSIIGPTGCGKSTLLRIAGGLLPPTLGAVSIDGAAPDEARLHKRIGSVFQDPALLPWLNVRGNIELMARVNRRHGPRTIDTDALLTSVGLSDAAEMRPHQLSGGMRQRAALARAFALEPALLLMDEPFAALDEITREAMRYELLRIWERRQATVLFVTHSVREAVALSDRVIVLAGTPGQLRADVPIDLPRPRRHEDERSLPFLDLVDRLRALL
ncbi:MAG: ABC transporter ATP-binding protein [Dehalococcoidia bacterium]|nr:ABC transporter ATP-binding protein [Dehalococcoidia bacterium]